MTRRTEIRIASLLWLIERGWSVKQAATVLGMHFTTAYGLLRRIR